MSRTSDVVLSLGSNHGDRKSNLHYGLTQLSDRGYSIQRISPIVESPAQLPPCSLSQWNRPYLNIVVQGSTNLEIDSFFRLSKEIQTECGRDNAQSKWAPRNLDIDLIFWGDETVQVNGKSIPDPSVYSNPFILSPLVHMAPGWKLPGTEAQTAFDLSCSLPNEFHIPLWMGIVNLTPDSFSDGGRYPSLDAVRLTVEKMIADGVNIIDIGAESTRPKATPLTSKEEWERLQPALELIQDVVRSSELGPQISVDTYHPESAEKALCNGVDVINDVSGLRNETMIALAKTSGKTFIAMHSVTVPVDPTKSIDPKSDACEIFENWIREMQVRWEAQGLDLNQIIVDPGIGFGKSSLQSLELMRSASRLRKLGHRLLIGHSRKSFLKSFAVRKSADLDTETVGASLQMCSKSVDILRVHDVGAHTRAYLSWAHLLNNRASI